MPYGYTIPQIKRAFHIALGVLKKNDDYLLKFKASERSVAHKLAEYLQDQFPDWNVDCEYNRQGELPKELDGIAECSVRKKNNRIFPDIIVHLRGKEKNLFVIELKKDDLYDACDIQKLRLLTLQNGQYRYALGLFLILEHNTATMRWFMDGKESEPKTFYLS